MNTSPSPTSSSSPRGNQQSSTSVRFAPDSVPSSSSHHASGSSNSARRRKGNKGGQTSGKHNGVMNVSKSFKGETESLNGNVYQLEEESKDATQFKRTTDAIERYAYKTHNANFGHLFSKLEQPTFEDPEPPSATSSDFEVALYENDVKTYRKRKSEFQHAMRAMYSVIYGQCSQGVIAKLLGFKDLEAWKIDGNCGKLLQTIQAVILHYEHKKSSFVVIFRQMRYFYKYKQRDQHDLHTYQEVFTTMSDNILRMGGRFGCPEYTKRLMMSDGVDPNDPNLAKETLKSYQSKADDKALAIAFLMGAKEHIYGELVRELENDFLKSDNGKDTFPSTVSESYHLLANYSVRKNARKQDTKGTSNTKVHVAHGLLQTSDDPVPGRNGVLLEHVRCYNCNKYGHTSKQCPVTLHQVSVKSPGDSNVGTYASDEETPSASTEDDTDSKLGFGFYQHEKSSRYKGLNKNWILLDTQSNCDIFRNPKLVSDIRLNPDGPLVLQSNGGQMSTKLIATVRGYGKVWFSKYSLANILSFSNIRKKFKVSIMTGPDDPEPSIKVHKPDGTVMTFTEYENGLYVHDTGSIVKHNQINTSYDYLFLNTVYANENNFTNRQVKSAKAALALYKKLGRPSITNFYSILSSGFLRDCPVTEDDARRAFHIYGPDIASIKGKSTRSTPSHIPTSIVSPIPSYIQEWHLNVTLCVDIFFLHGIPFLHTISRDLQFRTVEELSSRAYKHILLCLQTVFNMYEARGFTVQHLRGDSEFACLGDTFLPTRLHIATKSEHVPEIERSIRTVKDGCRSTIHGLPFQSYPKIMLRYLVLYVVRLLNIFPSKNGVSKALSPITIMTGAPPPSYHFFSLEYGTYVQVHDNPTITNTTGSRSTGAIALGPANDHGGWFFMSLMTGKRLLRYSWTELPIPADVISRVHDLAHADGQSSVDLSTFQWSPDVPVEDSDSPNYFIDIEGAHPASPVDIEAPVAAHADIEAHVATPPSKPDSESSDPEFAVPTPDFYPDDEEDAMPSDDEETTSNKDTNINNINETEGDSQRSINAYDDENNYFNILNNSANDNGDDDAETFEEVFGISEGTLDQEGSAGDQRSASINTRDQRSADIQNEDQLGMDTSNDEINDETNDENQTHHDEIVESNFVTDAEADVPLEEQATNADNVQRAGRTPSIVENNDVNEVHSTQRRGKLQYNLRNKINQAKERRFDATHYIYCQIAKHRKQSLPAHSHVERICNLLMEIEKNGPKSTVMYDLYKHVTALCFTQMSARKGIKLLGESAIEALAKEYSQLSDLKVFKPRYVHELSIEEKQAALNAIDLIKLKRNGTVKGRTVADGRKQRPYFEKHETSSPALSNEAFIATIVVDAVEERDVAITDVSGAFLKAEMPDYVLVKMRGPAVQAMLRANRKLYQPYVTYEKGEMVLYVQLLKAMYGTLKAALLWYQLFTEKLEKMGFILNPYDSCVANKMVGGHQLTVCWYVDDVKISHADPAEVSKIIQLLEEEFGVMNVSRGNKHTYLGMNIEIKDKKVHIMMRDYLQEAIDAYGEAITTNATTPATRALMEIDQDSKLLEKRRADIFHHIVAKLLHVAKRARLDLQVAIGFLCTRVRFSTEQDWNKLKRVLQYVRGTLTMPRILSMGTVANMDIFIDASHACHPDMKGQTGGCVIMGDGVIHSRSSKQTINSKSSTESELIGVSDYLPYPIWLMYFYESQGYVIGKRTLYQDNQSTMKLLRNGRKSSGKQTRHISIRHFWNTDRIKEHNVDVVYCPTESMLGDFFTKSLQGSLFRRMRDVVQGVSKIESLYVLNRNDENENGNETTDLADVNDRSTNVRKERVDDEAEMNDNANIKSESFVNLRTQINIG